MTILTFKNYSSELKATWRGNPGYKKGVYKVHGITVKRSLRGSLMRTFAAVKDRAKAYRQIYYAGGRSNAKIHQAPPAVPPIEAIPVQGTENAIKVVGSSPIASTVILDLKKSGTLAPSSPLTQAAPTFNQPENTGVVSTEDLKPAALPQDKPVSPAVNRSSLTTNKGADATCCNTIGCCFCNPFALTDCLVGGPSREYVEASADCINDGDCLVSKENANECSGNTCKVVTMGLCIAVGYTTFTLNRISSDVLSCYCTTCSRKSCCCDSEPAKFVGPAESKPDFLKSKKNQNHIKVKAPLRTATSFDHKNSAAKYNVATDAVVNHAERPMTAGSNNLLEKPQPEYSQSRSLSGFISDAHFVPSQSKGAPRMAAPVSVPNLVGGLSTLNSEGEGGSLTKRVSPQVASTETTTTEAASNVVTNSFPRDHKGATLSLGRTAALSSSGFFSAMNAPSLATTSSGAAPVVESARAAKRRTPISRVLVCAPRRTTGEKGSAPVSSNSQEAANATSAPGTSHSHRRVESIFTVDAKTLAGVASMFQKATIELHKGEHLPATRALHSPATVATDNTGKPICPPPMSRN